MRAKLVDVRPAILLHFARAGTFDVEDDLRSVVDRSDVDRSRCLDQHFVAVVAESLDQIERLALRERLAAGDFDELASVRLDARHHVVDRHLLATGECVFGIAPATPQIASGEANEHPGTAGVS